MCTGAGIQTSRHHRHSQALQPKKGKHRSRSAGAGSRHRSSRHKPWMLQRDQDVRKYSRVRPGDVSAEIKKGKSEKLFPSLYSTPQEM